MTSRKSTRGSRKRTSLLHESVRCQTHAPEKILGEARVQLLERRLGKGVEKGDVIVARKTARAQGLRKGAHYEVLGVGDEQLMVKTPKGEAFEVGREQLLKVGAAYKKVDAGLSAGDQLIYLGAKKPTRGEVINVDLKTATVALEDGRVVKQDLARLFAFEQGLVQTPFERRGAGREQVFFTCDHKVGSKQLFQAKDRALHRFEVFTDNAVALEKRFGWYATAATTENQKQLAEEFFASTRAFDKELRAKAEKTRKQIQERGMEL